MHRVGTIIEYSNATYVVYQFPVVLGYAISFHKSQGATYEFGYIDPYECFGPGMMYTGLSRFKKIENLYIIGDYLNLTKLKVDEKVLEWDRKNTNSSFNNYKKNETWENVKFDDFTRIFENYKKYGN